MSIYTCILTYRYRILNRPSPPGLEQGHVWHVRHPLDADAMQAAAQALLGLHDFTTFRDVACQAKSPVKTLDVATVARIGEEVVLVFEARSFLHRQVRSMTGSLAEVGQGRAREVRSSQESDPHGPGSTRGGEARKGAALAVPEPGGSLTVR